jgi:hypothetical protein
VRTILLASLMLALTAGCSLGTAGGGGSSPATVAPNALVPVVRYRGQGIAFAYPVAWSHRGPGFSTNMNGPVVDLSSQPLVNPCRHHGTTTVCGWPVDHMRHGAVVVSWRTGGMVAISQLSPPGFSMKVDRPGTCRSLGGDATIVARVVTRTHTDFLVTACLRGPGIAAEERAVRAMLASARAG